MIRRCELNDVIAGGVDSPCCLLRVHRAAFLDLMQPNPASFTVRRQIKLDLLDKEKGLRMVYEPDRLVTQLTE